MLIVFAFVTVLAGSIYGRTADEEIQAVRNYLDVLDAKLEKAKKQKQSAKVVLLHAQKAVALALVEEKAIVSGSDTFPASVILVTQPVATRPVITQPGVIPPATIIIYWMVFGLVVGSLTNFIVNGSRRGIAGSIFLGLLGAVVGGYLGQMFFDVGVTGFNILSFVLAIAGALVVILIDNLLRPKDI